MSLDRKAKAELRGWAGLAIATLGLAGVMALLLAISRVPGIETVIAWPADFFRKGLVVHVVFSFVAWFLAVAALLMQMAVLRLSDERARLSVLGPLGLAAGWIGAGLLFASALLGDGEASLNNYVPAILDPLFYVGLGLFACAPLLSTVRLLANLPGRLHHLPHPAVLGPVVAGIILIAAFCAIFAARQRLDGFPLSLGYNESLFWAGGHLAQFVNLCLMLTVWQRLSGAAPGAFRLAFLLAGLAVPAAAVILLFGSTHERQLFTDLQYGLAPAALIGMAALARALVQKQVAVGPGRLALGLSLAVFALGAALGLFVDGADTRTPGHYHGVIGGITLAFMGLFHAKVMPALDRTGTRTRLIRVQLWCYGLGQALQAIGLFVAGGYGTPRKAAGAEQQLSSLGEYVGMGLNGAGGLVAVIGGAIFVIMVAVQLAASPKSQA